MIKIQITDGALRSLNAISELHKIDRLDVIRLGVSLTQIVLDANKSGLKVLICTSEGEPVKEVCIPEEYKGKLRK